VLVFASVSGQNKPIANADYRMAEQFSPKKIKRMVFSTTVKPNWMRTGDKFWYSYKTSKETNYYIVDLSNKTKKLIFDNDNMASMLTLITKDPYNGQHLPKIVPKFKKGDSVFQFDVTSTQDEKVKKDENAKIDSTDSKKEDKVKKKPEKKVFHLEYNLHTRKLSEIKNWKEEKEDPKWANISPNGKYVIFARDYNLFWMDKENYIKAKNEEEDKKDSTIVEHQLTFDGEQYYNYGGGYTSLDNDDTEKIKKEQEKRYSARISWSQNSKKFALIRYDSRKVKSLWVIDVLADPRPELETYKYTMPGEKESSKQELWLFNMIDTSRKQIDVNAFNNQSVSLHRENKGHKAHIDENVPIRW
jgi:dipeptidyl-peptidase-4